MTNTFGIFVRGTLNKLSGKAKYRPYMKEKEIAIFTEILERNKPQKVLEYGCGFSTLYYPRFLQTDARWVSVEHNKEWYAIIKKQVGASVDLYLVPPDKENYKDEGYREDFVSYVEKGRQDGPYDLILIDGMAREVCIEEAKTLLAPNGLIVVHDANRVHYRDAMKPYSYITVFEDYRKTAGGMAFISDSHPADYYFDPGKHRRIWKNTSFWGNFFKFKFLLGKKGKTFKEIRQVKQK